MLIERQSAADERLACSPCSPAHRRPPRSSVSSAAPVGAVECLSNGSAGCSIALRGSVRWTYVYGNSHEAADVDIIVDGTLRDRDAPDGIVPWRERPLHFRKNCIARIPPPEVSYD